MKQNRYLFIIDESEYKYFEFNKLVTNFWFIKEFLSKGTEIEVATKRNLFIQNGKGYVTSNKAMLKNDNIKYEKTTTTNPIESFNAVFFRPDPPVDIDYINACNVFEFVDKTKTKLINNPLAIRNFNEKMHVNYFPNYVPKNIVTSSKKLIIDFVNQHQKAIIKPLNRCFGSGVFVLEKNDENISSIIATSTENEKTLVMIQEFLPGKISGDKRVLIIGNYVFDESVKKLPAPNDFKFAEHADAYFEKAPLTKEEKEVAQNIANVLNRMELPVVGLDMIDGKVIEINVTSPCFFIKEINDLYNTNIEEKIITELTKLIDCNKNSLLTV